MANTHTDLSSLFTDTADAIRAKTGGTDPIVADTFPEAITNITTGYTYAGTPAHSSMFEQVVGWDKSVFDFRTLKA